MSKEEKFELPKKYAIKFKDEFLQSPELNKYWVRFINYVNKKYNAFLAYNQAGRNVCVDCGMPIIPIDESIVTRLKYSTITLEDWISANVDGKGSKEEVPQQDIEELKEQALKYEVMREIFSSCNGLDNIEQGRVCLIINSLFKSYKIEKR